MSQEIEIEFKNLLTAQEFERLCSQFGLQNSDFTLQHNHYFDTADFMMKKKGCALRIREKNGRTILTLKQPHPAGLLETHQPLTEGEAAAAKASSEFPDGEVTQILETMDVFTSSLHYLGKLSTKRAETDYKSGLLVLDHSFYLGKEDFELEYESREKVSGEKIFDELLVLSNIPKRETENKIRRFFNRSSNHDI